MSFDVEKINRRLLPLIAMAEGVPHRVNNDGSVNLRFGRDVDTYVQNLNVMREGARFKRKSRERLNEAHKRDGLVTVHRCEGSVDHKMWGTADGKTKSTNRLDDIIRLTPKGRDRVAEIMRGTATNVCVWHWVWFCAGQGNCQRACGGLGRCLQECDHYSRGPMNQFDMHYCSVRVITKVMLSAVEDQYPVNVQVIGHHIPAALQIPFRSSGKRINLSLENRDMVIRARRENCDTPLEIKRKMLNPFNNQSPEILGVVTQVGKRLCTDKQLEALVMRDKARMRDDMGAWTRAHYLLIDKLRPYGFILHYQRDDPNMPEDDPARYYVCVMSSDVLLGFASRYGQQCFGIDSKHDLNKDRAPVLAMCVEDEFGWAVPIGFAQTNKENNHTIRLAVETVGQNLPCDNQDCDHAYQYEDLPNGKGFRRIRPCSRERPPWRPYAMMDKHRPTKLALMNIARRTILCTFHVMQTLGDLLQSQKIPKS
jgi:hypothetical protein